MKGSKAFAGAAFIGAGVFLGIGAITGNLGGMLAALFDSSELDVASKAASSSGTPVPKSTAATTGHIHNPASGGLGSTGSTVIRPSSLPGAGSTGAPGLR
jgi:hypothetical protein